MFEKTVKLYLCKDYKQTLNIKSDDQQMKNKIESVHNTIALLFMLYIAYTVVSCVLIPDG